jgi:hypothetical protein
VVNWILSISNFPNINMVFFKNIASVIDTTVKFLSKSDVVVRGRVREVKYNKRKIAEKLQYSQFHTSGFRDRNVNQSDGDLIPFGLNESDVELLEDFYSKD